MPQGSSSLYYLTADGSFEVRTQKSKENPQKSTQNPHVNKRAIDPGWRDLIF